MDPLVAAVVAAATCAALLVVAAVAGVLHVRRLHRDLRRSRDRHRRALRRDPLTGVATRAALRDRLEALDGSDGYAVLVVDLDEFAAVNERHGETVGDQVLAEVARRIVRCARSADVVGRLDGDAFAVVRAGRATDDVLAGWVEQVLAAVRAPLVLTDGTRFTVTASAGRASSAAGMRPLAVVRAAEQNMLTARRSRDLLDHAVDSRLGPRRAGLRDVELPRPRQVAVPGPRSASTAETALVGRPALSRR
jgi:diguanylate cyclase (GGDEF)-like protein